MLGIGTSILAKRRTVGYPAVLRSFWQRVRDEGGTMVDFNSAVTAYRSAPTASLITTPAAYDTDKLYSVVPAGGAGDFTVTGGGNAVSQRPDGYWQINWPANTPRYRGGSNMLETSRQILITYPRTFTDAEWNTDMVTIEGGYACPFVDASGVNTNEAYRLTATDDNGSIKRTTPITTVAASTYANGIFIRRITGTGAVSLVDINDTDRAVTITSEWAWYEYAAAAAGTSGQIGVKLAVSGDVVEICHAQPELGAASTSPIYGDEDALQTRNTDNISNSTIGVTGGDFQIFFTIKFKNPIRGAFRFYNAANAEIIRCYLNSVRVFSVDNIIDGGNVQTIALDLNTFHKICIKISASTLSLFVNGVKIVTTTAITATDVNKFILHQSFGYTSEFDLSKFMVVKNLSDAKCIELTA